MKLFDYKRNLYGIKGDSILLNINNFDIVWNFPPDYMHGSLLGVTKQLYNTWSHYLSKKENRKLLDSRMSNIKLTRDLQRALWPLDLVKKYKALEWEIWLLFVSVPCLHGILPEKMFHSYLLFVHSIYTLLKDSISQVEIHDCEYKLLQFVGECELLYGLHFETFNVCTFFVTWLWVSAKLGIYGQTPRIHSKVLLVDSWKKLMLQMDAVSK